MTRTAKHTPGPWTIRGTAVVVGGDGFTVAGLYDDRHAERESGELEANARLIVAAPRLLAALERLMHCPDLNLDELEAETEAARAEAIEVLREALA